jgi:hypothetical protein
MSYLFLFFDLDRYPIYSTYTPVQVELLQVLPPVMTIEFNSGKATEHG